MAFVHGKNTYIALDNNDLSAFTNTSEITKSADIHDITHYGPDPGVGRKSHEYQGGLGDGTATMGGTYDNTAAGPRAIIDPLVGSTVLLDRRIEGTGAGKPRDLVYAVCMEYVESSPVADMVSWTCNLQLSGAVTGTAQ